MQHPAIRIELRDAASSGKLAQLLRRHSISPAVIKQELTESFLMDNAIATHGTCTREGAPMVGAPKKRDLKSLSLLIVQARIKKQCAARTLS
ncbi:MAG: hypothetical protein LH632_10205 [Rhodoferax sp.]|nr:hypothetical protein [Rhodoferax sp.]